MPQHDPLPVDAVLEEVTTALRAHGGAVLVAPPGAGKTTRIPPALAQAGHCQVVVVEPRRVAARAAARRVAAESGRELGREVGYHVRFDRRASAQTQVLFCTEGILLQRLQDDPFLEGVGCVVFDEYHERSLAADLALAMTRRVQQEARDDLRLLVMSATLDAEAIATWLGVPAVQSEGRLHSVETRFLPLDARRTEGRDPQTAHVAQAIRVALADSAGDVLAFLPGVGEIRRVRERLETAGVAREVDLHELYGDLAPERQDAALRASPGRRRVVLATNVAQTSVTVQGVRAVVDSGLARVLRHDRGVGLDRLVTERIDRASADQRTGRAGREAPGLCLRLWSAADDRALAPFLEPEIRRVDLAGPVLELACWGESDPSAFPWFEQPAAEATRHARTFLRELGAIDARGRPTEQGRRMRALPLPPRLAALVLAGHEAGNRHAAATAAAWLSERDPFRARGDERFDASDSDVLDRVHALGEFERNGRSTFPFGDLQRGGARAVLRARDQILRALPRGKAKDSGAEDGGDDEGLLRALLVAYPDRLCRRRSDDRDRGVLVGGRGVRLGRRSAVTEGELFLAVLVDAGRTESVVHVASSVERAWVDGGRTRVTIEAVFDERTERVVGRRRTRLGPLVLDETDHPLSDPQETERVLLDAARANPSRALGLERDSLTLVRARLECLREWRPELQLPTLDEAFFAELLPLLVNGCRSFADLASAPTGDALLGTLDHEQRQALENDAPERLAVPSGSRLRLTYEAGRPPVLAVRIQELFGLQKTPTVCGGRVRVLLHLLAPNGRPQQVTDDLESFWRETYFLVRKDLRARYPRHDWPDDPLRAQAQKRPRRRR